MDLTSLRALGHADQRTFLLGRVVAETASLDAALRFFHAALDGRREIDAFRDAPDQFRANVRECSEKVAAAQLADVARAAFGATLLSAANVYDRRNRFVHDLLRDDVLSQRWELMRLNRKGDEVSETDLDDMVQLVEEIVGITWRLRGGALYVLQGGWESIALGEVEGQWDGNANTSRG